MSKRQNFFTAIISLLVISIGPLSCKKEPDNPGVGYGPGVDAYVLTDQNDLYMVNGYSNVKSGRVSLSGLDLGEKMIAIDIRPATGQLYGISDRNRIYIIDGKTGSVRAIGNAGLNPGLNGTAIGFDFNPTVDRIRVITADGQNLRINPETGSVVAVDATIASTNQVSAVAYTENRAVSWATTLYAIDTRNDKLLRLDSPNEGKFTEVGLLEVDVEDAGGFDFSPLGHPLAALYVNGASALYQIDSLSGQALRIGNLDGKVVGLAILTDPVAYAISPFNELVSYNTANGSSSGVNITGLQQGEQVLGIDMRPLNGQLYILGSSSRLYTVNAATGVAVAVGNSTFNIPLWGTGFGFDFNPVVDRIRIVSNYGQNLRVHPETGEVTSLDGYLNPGTPSVTAAAYTNNFFGATTTTLYVIDSETNVLYKQDPPNDGKLTAVGALGVDMRPAIGFDVSSTSATAYAVFSITNVGAKLYKINLNTGNAEFITNFIFETRGFTMGLGF